MHGDKRVMSRLCVGYNKCSKDEDCCVRISCFFPEHYTNPISISCYGFCIDAQEELFYTYPIKKQKDVFVPLKQ